MEILLFILFILAEPIKRILSFFLYPLIYPFRDKLRHDTLHLCLWNDYLYLPKFKWLWFFLDDSIKMESGHEYSTEPNRINSYWFKSEFGKSYHWSAIRNSCVNWNNYMAYKIGFYIKTLKRWGSINNFIELRQYDNGKRLYCEFFIGSKFFQFGTLRGNRDTGGASRFEIDLFKTRTKK